MVREVVIVYATATGTAEELAGEVYRQLYGIGVQAKVVNIKSLTTLTPKSKSTNTTGGKENPADEWYNKLYVFLVATSGQGIEPPDMRYFWHRYLLRKSLILIPDTLDTSNGRIPTHRLQYCVFGLGDSSYEFYNFAAKKLDKRLGLVGGERIGALGLGDDQHYWGVYGGFLPWVDRLREYISKNLGEYKNVHVGIDVGHGGMVPVLNRLPSEEELEKEMSTDLWNGSELDEQYYNAQVVDNKLITDQAHEFDAIRKIQLNLTVNNRKNEVAEYLPGDVIEIHPQNSDEAVVRLMERLGLVCASDQNKCMDASGWMDEAKERVIKHVLKYRVDLNAVARQTTIRMLSQFITNRGFESESESVLAMKIDKFRKLGEFQEIDEYYRYVVRPKRNILEVLEDDFGELEFDVRSVGEYLLDILHPRLVGRQNRQVQEQFAEKESKR
ncbi:NADPH-dependent diflavin oxidoreductase 1 [Zancudomyces culisetae]|uniref:NADPH-dependent diflavin oxidoreductase 1 n=1 Tax=Zancudomyces culisetae TaxID=1213189 RepID=A0A1R1PYB7_ZANCU|nr:NADPH-dependent diflavin oxidoreductase 1 [Zancudomyces culisetae]|eukprot:OMH85928.1 NADPH-dependent diflavin oxidoreductase 1 [Zancudomyces culisetae]